MADSFPAAIAGLLLEKLIAGSFRSPILILFPLIIVSFLMIYAERRARPAQPLEAINLKNSLIIGCAQALALVPGVSRSGITITAGLLRGYERGAATRFSFLLSTPAIAGATLLQLRHLSTPGMTADWPVFAIGFASAGLVGYLAIAFLMRYLRQHTLNVFAGYRLALAAAVIFWMIWKGSL